LKILFEKLKFLEIGGGAVLLLWAHIFSPFGMNRQNGIIRALGITFFPFGHK
jgi:hypothetical protein